MGSAESGNSGHNVADLNKLITECAEQMLDIKAQRKELNEQAADVRERLRDAGVQTKPFEFALKLKEMEREGRNEYLDNLRLSFDALGIGSQHEMFPTTAQPSAEAATTH